MELLYVANSRFPSERAHMTQIVKMCNAFSDVGAKTTLAITDRPTHIKESPESYYGEKIHFEVIRVPVLNMANAAGKMPSLIGRFLYMLQRILYVWNLGDISRYDIVYGRDPIILYLLGIRYGFSKIVYESHEAHFNFFVRSLVKKGVRMIVISEGIHDFYMSKGVPKAQMTVAHDAVDEKFLNEEQVTQEEARKSLGFYSEKPVVMYIGGFDKWKGVETFFTASEQTNKVQFVAIGGSEKQISSFKDKYQKVLFLGSRPYSQLVENQQAADILVIPNSAKSKLSAFYTSPLKLFAHMASGIPMVVSDIPSLCTVVDEDVAYFFKADNPTDLISVIEKVFLEPEKAHHKANKARQLAKKYTWKERAVNVIDYIN